MQSHLTHLLARQRHQELNAAARGRIRETPLRPLFASIAVRPATANDREALERLAALDSTEPPRGSTLVGELLQRLVAALSLSDGRVIADPFVATADLVALLRLRARQLGAGRPRRWRKRGTATQPTPARYILVRAVPHRPEASNQPTSSRRQRIMKTAIAPNVQPDRHDGEKWPAPVPELPDGAREATNARPLDPTQGRKIGSEPYDDPTQGRQIGSDPYDDPTRGRKVGADPYEDPTQGRKVAADPYDDPTQGQKIGSDPYDDPTRGR
jgi:hypothetical protein